MAQTFILVNEHSPEECAAMDADSAFAPELKGKPFYCSCPYGVHGFFILAEGDSAEQVIRFLPPAFRPGTRVQALEVFTI